MLFLSTFCLGIHSVTLSLFIPLNDAIFYQSLIFVAENYRYKHCGDVCNARCLEIVRQYILGVVSNFIHIALLQI